MTKKSSKIFMSLWYLKAYNLCTKCQGEQVFSAWLNVSYFLSWIWDAYIEKSRLSTEGIFFFYYHPVHYMQVGNVFNSICVLFECLCGCLSILRSCNFSSGSSGQVDREIWNLWLPSAAILFMTNFYRAGGGGGTLDPLLNLNCTII